jgi:hypothetical protein
VAKEPDWLLFVDLQATCLSADQVGYDLGDKGPHVGQAFLTSKASGRKA